MCKRASLADGAWPARGRARKEHRMAEYLGRLLSADSHVVEPPDLWTERIDARFRDRAPRIQTLDDGNDYSVIDGLRPRPLAFEGAMADMKAQGMDIPAPSGFRFEDNRRGAWDPTERLADQDMDGVSGEVVYPGVGLTLVMAPDPEYLYASCRAYNDWLGEFCATAPDRLKGVAMLPCRGPVEWAVEEAERAAKLGHASVMLPAWSDDRPYNLPDWDPLWAALQDMGLVASIHIGGRQPFGKAHGPGAGGIIVGLLRIEMADPLLRLIWGGAPVRFPRLKWALVESGIGWIASVLGFMDHWWNDHRGWLDPKLPEPPSHYFHQQFFATFENDRAGVLTRELLGESNLMWGSDYPHTEGVWPFSRRLVGENFAGVDESETRKMVHDNVAALYGFPSD
jgi:predicted TIM-barrel fold metal-dependent hydrolase